MEDALASRLSGLLYGNILHRDSDDDGFDYHFGLLKNNEIGLNDLIVKFFTSDEFIEKFVVNQTPNELVTNLLRSFFGPLGFKDADHSALRKTLVHAGLDEIIRKLVQDNRFAKAHSANGVPRYVEQSSVRLVQAAAE
jgi:hypothetical protein